MNLLIVTNGPLHQDENRVFVEPGLRQLIDPLLVEGVKIMMASRRNYSTVADKYRAAYPKSDITIDCWGAFARIKIPQLSKVFSHVASLFILFRSVKKNDFCYLFLPGSSSLIAGVICLILKTPYSIYLRNDPTQVIPQILRPLAWRIMRASSFNVITGAHLTEVYGRLNERSFQVVPMLSMASESNVPSRVRETDVFNILFVGQMIEAKGIFLLLDAFGMLKSRCNWHVHLTFVGEGRDRGRLIETARDLCILEYVSIKGAVQDSDTLRVIFKGADVFCLPTFYPEGFPRVIYEAMSFNLPIITTSSASVAKEIGHGRSGILLEELDPGEICDQLLLCMSDDEKRRQIGNEARERFEMIRQAWVHGSHGEQFLSALSDSRQAVDARSA